MDDPMAGGAHALRSQDGLRGGVISSTRPGSATTEFYASRPVQLRGGPRRGYGHSLRHSSDPPFQGRLLACRLHRFMMTTSRYSLGTTMVPSSALFMRPMRSKRSFSNAFCFRISRAANALRVGP